MIEVEVLRHPAKATRAVDGVRIPQELKIGKVIVVGAAEGKMLSKRAFTKYERERASVLINNQKRKERNAL